MDNLDFLLALFSQYLFSTAKDNITELEYYFSTNPNTRDNSLIKELVYAIKTYDLENIDLPLFQSICARSGKTEAESKEIINKIIQWKSYSKDKLEPTRKALEDICSASVLQKANNLFPNDPTAFLNYVKKAEVKVNKVQDVMTTTSFNNLDINTLIADEHVCGAPSYFEFINKSFAPHNCVEFGQMVLVCMPPGTGKSLYAMTEFLNFGCRHFRSHYCALGDLKMSDFIVRLCAIYSGYTFWDARKNLAAIYKSLCNVIGDNLGITCLPAGSLTIDEYVDYIKTTDYKIVFLDYDGNISNPEAGDNMYLSFGRIYDRLTELTAEGRLVYVLAQPVKAAWEMEEIGLSFVGESSKKTQVADILLTRGRYADSENHLGVFNLCKNRRGEENVKAYSVRLNNGRFKIVPKQIYKDLKEFEGKANWTDADIDGMIANYERMHAQIAAAERSAAERKVITNAGVGPNPFSR